MADDIDYDRLIYKAHERGLSHHNNARCLSFAIAGFLIEVFFTVIHLNVLGWILGGGTFLIGGVYLAKGIYHTIRSFGSPKPTAAGPSPPDTSSGGDGAASDADG